MDRNIELLNEILTQPIIGRSDHEKWQLLYPLSEQLNFFVDFKRVLFYTSTYCDQSIGLELQLHDIYSILVKGNHLYILITYGYLYTFGLYDHTCTEKCLLDGISWMKKMLVKCLVCAKKVKLNSI